MTATATRKANELVGMPAKRPRGRLPGMPKVPGSGRKKHVRDRWREELEELFEHNAVELAEFLFKVALGRKVSAPDPNDPTKTIRRICSPDLREKCAKTLLSKGWPNVARVEHTGPAGVPLHVNITLVSSA